MKRTEIKHPKSSFRWIDVSSPEPKDLSALAIEFSLHPRQVEDCLEPFHLPKYESVEGIQFLMLRVIDEAAKGDPITILDLTRKLAIFASRDFVITIHRSELLYLQELMKKWDSRLERYEKDPKDHLVLDLMSESFETFDRELDKAESERDDLELAIFALKPKKYDIETLYRLKRRASVIRRVLRLSHEAVGKFASEADLDLRIYAHDLKDDLENTLNYSEDLMEGLNQILSTHHAFEGQRANEVMKVLAIFSAFFFPLTLIAGIYGMNFRHIPELDWEWGYPASLVLMAFTTLFIAIWFRHKKWL